MDEKGWVNLLDLIESRKVIPIVGRRLSLVDTGGEAPVPFQTAVAEGMAKELGVDPLPPTWGLNELFLSAAGGDNYNVDAFHPKLKRVIGALKPSLEPLRKIAEITDFSLFLTTAIDGFLEQAVREVRGADGKVVTSFTFAPGCENPQQPLGQRGEVCVYKLLGGRETCPNWAVTVEGVDEFVLALQSDKYHPEKLFDALKHHHLLTIGCQIPDWLGRFFLRSLHDGPISAQRTANILIEDDRDMDAAFARNLKMFGQKSFVVPGDPFAFVDELHRRWKERAPKPSPGPLPGHLPEPRPEGEPPLPPPGVVFISYSHDDRASAEELYEFLRSQRIDVWKDDRDDALPPASNWDRVITRQIKDCACFVPLISRNTESVRQGYFWKEWNLALNRLQEMDSYNRKFIFPVVTEAGVNPPEQFSAMQWALLNDKTQREALARELRKEQQSLRKERR